MGGVSQQPDPLKLPGQVREAVNVLLDPTFGCKKRPPTKFISKLSSTIPANAKWFPIFRDENEKYIVAVYKVNGVTTLKVWEADTGAERTVTIQGSSTEYLNVNNIANLKTLTINDYTLLCNSERQVSMSQSNSGTIPQEAVVVVNQVAYNTTYSIDFLKDGQTTTQQKIYRATKLVVSPGSFEDETNGNCSFAGSQSYSETSGSKTGLSFTLTTNCNPTLVTDTIPGAKYPTSLRRLDPLNEADKVELDKYMQYYNQAYFTYYIGNANDFAPGSYQYRTFTHQKPVGDISVRVEARVEKDPASEGNNRWAFVSAAILSYTTNTGRVWAEGMPVRDVVTIPTNMTLANGNIIPAGSTAGIAFVVSRVQEGPSSNQYTYKSVYNARVTLNNGGSGWRKGDTTNVTLMGKTYTITVEEEAFSFNYASESQVSYTTPVDSTTGVLNVASITSGLTSGINGIANYQATPVGNVIYIKRTDSREFNIQARGGTTNNALYAFKGSVNDISLLPNQCVPGMIVKVRNAADSDADDYYVKFVAASGDIPGQGSWEETVKPGIRTDLNNSTMPHAMIRQSDGSFVVRPLSATFNDTLFWAGREVGDEKTNPEPTFVGRTISDMFFFMNRLGFLSDDAVILSQPGDYFNFFQGSAIAISDADPIDMTASATKPAKLKAAIGTPKGLLLFAENSQFLLATSEAAFGPATVKMTELSNYAYTSQVKPLETGVSILFSTEANTYSKVFEMAVDSIDNRPLVAENTRIVPEYIPPGLTFSTASPNNSFVVYGDDSDTLYTFKFFNVGNERSLAGWAKWKMPCPVRLVGFAHDSGYMVLYNEPDFILTKLEMLDDPDTSPIDINGTRFIPRLDNYHYKAELSTTTEGNDVKVRFPAGSYIEEKTPNVIFTKGGTATLFLRPEIELDNTGYYVTIPASVASEDYILGLEYDMKVVLPSFYLVADKRADRNNIPIVENAYLDLYFSGRYRVTVDKVGYSPVSIDLDVTTSDIYNANIPAIQEVTTKAIPVYSRGDFVTITIDAQDPLPASITSYSWEGHYSNRGISIIR